VRLSSNNSAFPVADADSSYNAFEQEVNEELIADQHSKPASLLSVTPTSSDVHLNKNMNFDIVHEPALNQHGAGITIKIESASSSGVNGFPPASSNQRNNSNSSIESMSIEEAKLVSLPFGKHKLVPLERVPDTYVQWLSSQPDFANNPRNKKFMQACTLLGKFNSMQQSKAHTEQIKGKEKIKEKPEMLAPWLQPSSTCPNVAVSSLSKDIVFFDIEAVSASPIKFDIVNTHVSLFCECVCVCFFRHFCGRDGETFLLSTGIIV
jgi:hypothetical protein